MGLSILHVPDTHVPAHDSRAVAALCRHAETKWYDYLIFAGDFVDHETISRFVKDSPGKQSERLIDEWALARSLILKIGEAARKKNPKCRIVFCQGNHEARLTALEDRIPTLAGLFDLPKELGITELGGTWLDADDEGSIFRLEWKGHGRFAERVIKPHEELSELRWGGSFFHGWSFSKYSASQTADMLPLPGFAVFGHVHQYQAQTSKRWGTAKTEAIAGGYLGKLNPGYTKGRATPWRQGFLEIYMDNVPGLYEHLFKPIKNGRICAAQ